MRLRVAILKKIENVLEEVDRRAVLKKVEIVLKEIREAALEKVGAV